VGADGYATKSFGLDELLARIRVGLHRAPGTEQYRRAEAEGFTVDLDVKRVVWNGSEVHLTPKKWGLIEALVGNPGRPMPQRQLPHDVLGPRYETKRSICTS
jgi:two-component system KDP operon response regulator KdpE